MLIRLIQSRSSGIRLTRVSLEVGSGPDAYVQGRADSAGEVNTLLGALVRDPHLAGMYCEWWTFDETGKALFGLRSPLHVHPKVATLDEMRRTPPPRLAELVAAFHQHDRDGTISKSSRLRMLWCSELDRGWKACVYDFTADLPGKDETMDALLRIMGNLEAHFPTLRVTHLDMRQKESGLWRVQGRLNVYSPPPR